MSSYICEKCGCIDNSGCGGNFWVVKMNRYKKEKGEPPSISHIDEYENWHYLCSECYSGKFSDGSCKDKSGWHDRFEKRHWSEVGSKEELIRICDRGDGSFVNAREFFGVS